MWNISFLCFWVKEWSRLKKKKGGLQAVKKSRTVVHSIYYLSPFGNNTGTAYFLEYKIHVADAVVVALFGVRKNRHPAQRNSGCAGTSVGEGSGYEDELEVLVRPRVDKLTESRCTRWRSELLLSRAGKFKVYMTRLSMRTWRKCLKFPKLCSLYWKYAATSRAEKRCLRLSLLHGEPQIKRSN